MPRVTQLAVGADMALMKSWLVIKQGGEEDDRTFAELMTTIEEKSQNISYAVAELKKLLADIKED